jgi:hypothetical protein
MFENLREDEELNCESCTLNKENACADCCKDWDLEELEC